MILWKSKETRETKPMLSDIGIRAWRKVLEVSVWRPHGERTIFAEVAFAEQVKMGPTAAWRQGNKHLSVWLSTWWNLGVYHGWYDGENCHLGLGFIHFSRSGYPCKKCSAEVSG